MPLTSAIIGTGHIARQHLACLKQLSAANVVAVCDLSPALAASTAERYNVPAWFTNHKEMLARTKPDIVHVTTPPQSHFPLAMDALNANAHVFVEKPLTLKLADLETLSRTAAEKSRHLIEDYNYLFNAPVKRLTDLVASGTVGSVVHVEVFICLDILGKDSRFADPNVPHPLLSAPGGAIYDFLTHLAYLAHAFIGPHKSAQTTWIKRDQTSPLPADEFRAVIESHSGATAHLAFSSHSQPDVFWLRLHTTKIRAHANLFENRLTNDELRSVPRPLIPLFNALRESRHVRNSAIASLFRKLSGGPGAYEGLWTLLNKTYDALSNGKPPPITPTQIQEVNALLHALTANIEPSVSRQHLLPSTAAPR